MTAVNSTLPKPLWPGLLLSAFGAIAFSGKAIIVKLAYRHDVDAVTLIMLRMVFALPLFVALALWTRFARASGDFQFAELTPWISTFNVNYSLGIDGMSLLLIRLNCVPTVLAGIAGWEVTKQRVPQGRAAGRSLAGPRAGVGRARADPSASRSSGPGGDRALDGAGAAGPVPRGAVCGAAYDLPRAGRNLDGKLTHLDPLPLIDEGGEVRIAVGAAG